MKAMILAAGLGRRMRPLTDALPKPLLQVGGKSLIEYHINRLRDAGVRELIINLAYRGDQIREHLGNGDAWDVSIQYSEEGEPLETGGAILQALPLLGEDPFVLVNGDVWTDFDFARLLDKPLSKACLGRLVMVPNPNHNRGGDFVCDQDGYLQLANEEVEGLTYSGISLLDPALVRDYPQARQRFPLVECFRHAIDRQQLQGEIFNGQWWDIGTPERLQQLDTQLTSASS